MRLGMRPQLAEDGTSAPRRMGEAADAGRAFPLVLLDGNSPDLDGFSVAERSGPTRDWRAPSS